MALFDKVTEDEEFAEEIEFTGEVRLTTPVIPSCSGTPGVIFDKSSRKKGPHLIIVKVMIHCLMMIQKLDHICMSNSV